MSRVAPHFPVVLPETLSSRSLQELREQLARGISSGLPLLLRGGTPGVFCNGLNLEEGVGAREELNLFADTLIQFSRHQNVTVAIVDGTAFGGGFGLAAACDRVIASPRSRFALPELLWGFVPAAIWPVVAARLGCATARWWVLTGTSRDAAEALASGAIDEVVDSDKLQETAVRAFRACRRADGTAIPLLRQLVHPDLAARVSAGARITADRLLSPDVQGRIAAFARGDVPWSGHSGSGAA